MNALEAVGITKRFGSTTALEDVRLEVAQGSIHALVGRNGAGKSTLVSILTGLTRPDCGSIQFHGEPAPPLSDRSGWHARVACVYQHSMIVPHLSVAENIFLNRQPTVAGGAIDWRALRRDARDLLVEWRLHIDIDARAGTLNVEERQLIEIVRDLSFGARFIILDEPTARLETGAIERLFLHLRALNAAGVTILYISHHLQELYELCDSVTVLRDGRRICTSSVAALPEPALIDAMTGDAKEGTNAAGASKARRDAIGEVILEVANLSGDGFANVSASIRSGEIVGIAGVGGSGKVALAETIAGLRSARGGSARFNGVTLHGGVRRALRAGIGFVPRDRHNEGLIPDLSIDENATLTIDDRLGAWGVIDPRRRRRTGETAMRDLEIVARSAGQPVRELSGGNQQKVVFARALARDPKLLIAIDPSAGVDVKSKESLQRHIGNLRDRGKAVILVTDDLDDLRRCDRVLILHGGRLTGEVHAGWRDAELIARMEGLGVA